MRFAFAFSLIALLAVPSAFAGGIADGEYDCASSSSAGIMPMGKMDIDGDTYRFRPFGNVTDGYSDYSVSGTAISWSGPMGGLTAPPSAIQDSTVTSGTSFNVRYLPRPGGYTETMSCHQM